MVGPPIRLQTLTRILLVSDDVQFRALLSELLVAHGYHVTAFGGAVSLSCRSAPDWDAAIVDASAPSGATRLVRMLEMSTRVPTIAITTNKSATAAGPLWNRADAVLNKPFDARELLLVVRGLCAGHQVATRAEQALNAGPLTLHWLLNTAIVAAREISLTGVETRILRELMLAVSTPVSRDRLTRCALSRGWSPGDRGLDTHVKRLRRKLGADRSGKTPVRTVRGVGYLLLEHWQPAS